jgi:hypothetical protein
VLLLTVRKFFCRVNSCPRKVFTERLPDLLEASSRLTTRLRTAVQSMGCIRTAKAGERLSKGLSMPHLSYYHPALPVSAPHSCSFDGRSGEPGRTHDLRNEM